MEEIMNLGHTIYVLDHGYVKLIDTMGTDETIIEAARMSTGRGFEGWEKDAKLLEFLYKNSHMTPFEMCELTLEVKLPIMVVWEWVRHRTMSFNIESGRYTQLANEHYLPNVGRVQKQSKMNKQGSAEAVPEDEAQEIIDAFRFEQDFVYKTYETLVNEQGIAKELARLNCPMSRYTKMRVKTDLRNWLHFLNLRMASNAQWEIWQYANAVASIVENRWPRTYQLFENHTLNSVKFSASELELIRYYLGKKSKNVQHPATKAALEKLGI